MKIAGYDIRVLNTGLFRLDGGAMFGVVPKALWEKRKPPDAQNRIDMCTNMLLLRGNGRTILVDTGIGEPQDEKFRKIYAVDTSTHNLFAKLAACNVRPADVTDVILTHLHFDHAGGATVTAADGSVQPAFPNAKYYIQQRHYEWSTRPSMKDRASFLPENFQPLVETGQLVRLAEAGVLFPGIELLVSDGHTVGQQMLIIHDDKKTLFYPADLVPTSAHVPVPWVMAYDLYPLVTIEEKKKYLQRAADGEWLVVFIHDPETPCATIAHTEKGFALNDIITDL